MKISQRPIVLIHGLWNTSEIFKAIASKLEEKNFEYYAPTLKHDFGLISIIEIAKDLNDLIIEKYGISQEIDILGFSMGGLIGRYWIKKFDGYKRTKRFISIGSPHKGTFTAQFVPSYPLKGISEMKINSNFLKELSKNNHMLENIDCFSFYTKWDLMVFPGWKAYLPKGHKYSLSILKHKNLIRNTKAVNKIVDKIIN